MITRILRKIVRKSKVLKRTIKKVTLSIDTHIGEIHPLKVRRTIHKEVRLNLIVPSINEEHIFGGIATALKFFEELGEEMDVETRIITVDATPSKKDLRNFEKYQLTFFNIDSEARHQIIPFNNRDNRTLPVGKHDVFMATSWWTAYFAQNIIEWQADAYGVKNKMIYFIQDYEPGFYAWSSRYILADSTYKAPVDIVAVFNSKLLEEFFKKNSYKFFKEYYFEPKLNSTLKARLMTLSTVKKERRIIIYGRPSVQRNSFSLITEALRIWAKDNKFAKDWEILSLGEKHPDIEIAKNMKVVSMGKLSLDRYSSMLASSYAGISLMVSPHPSYPPLEMSSFGVKTITNSYANKDISTFSRHIISMDNCNPRTLAEELKLVCRSYERTVELATDFDNPYYDDKPMFEFIPEVSRIMMEKGRKVERKESAESKEKEERVDRIEKIAGKQI